MSHGQRLSLFAACGAVWFLWCTASWSVGTTNVAPAAENSNPKSPPAARVLRDRQNAQANDSHEPVLSSLKQRVISLQKARLSNGMRVIMDVESESPTVAICVTYDVGSRNEGPGQSGFAHLFEHMMFQGSRHVSKGKHFQIIASRGGTLNGTTSADRTNYFETLPANELELALWLEADRMRWLNVTEENLDNQRAVVKEEYRMRYENAPYRLAQIELDKRIFAGYAPYAHPTIGNLEDLDRAQISWVKDFHARYYVPSNAVLTIAGGFEPDKAMHWVHEYFDKVEANSAPTFTPPAALPVSTEETRLELTDKNAKTPALLVGWRIVPHNDSAHSALELLARLLADGESSILYESLVRDKAWARNVSAYTYDHSGPDGLVISVELTQTAQFEQVEPIIHNALATLTKTGPKPAQLNRARQRAKSSFLFDLQSNQSRATTFGEYEVVFGDARLIVNDLEQLLAVTPEAIRSAASHYLTPTARTVIRVVPVDVAKTPKAGAQP